jgi:hypothetical protein
VDVEVPITNGTEADGEDVWFWRLDAGVKFADGNFRKRRRQDSPISGKSAP